MRERRFVTLNLRMIIQQITRQNRYKLMNFTRNPFAARGAVATMTAVLLFSAHDAAADASISFGAFQNAVLDGKSIGMTLDLSKCVIHNSTESGPPVKGAQKFDAFMIQGDQTIAFSSMHFRLRSDRTPVQEHFDFRVHPDGKIEVTCSFLNPVNLTVLQEARFDCKIDDGAVFHW